MWANAIEKRNFDALGQLLKDGFDVNANTHFGTALSFAARCNDTELVAFLLAHGAKVIDDDATHALVASAEYLEGDAFKLIIEAGSKIRAESDLIVNALYDHAHRGRDSAVKWLIERGGNISLLGEGGRNALQIAVSHDDLGAVQILLQFKPSLDVLDFKGRTALFKAVSSRSVRISQLLLNQGADPNLANAEGVTPLMRCVEVGPDDRKEFGRAMFRRLGMVTTGLKQASFKKPRIPLLQALLKAGANPNARDHAGSTALHRAINMRRIGEAQLLVEAGANPNLCDNNGSSVLSLASKRDDFGFLFNEHNLEGNAFGQGTLIARLLDALVDRNALVQRRLRTWEPDATTFLEAFDLKLKISGMEDELLWRAVPLTDESKRLKLLNYLDASWHGLLTLGLATEQSFLTYQRALRRKAITTEIAFAQRAAVWNKRFPELQELIHDLADLRKSEPRGDIREAGRGSEDPATRQKRRLELEAALAQRIPDLDVEARIRAATSQSVAAMLPGDSCLVEFVKVHIFDFTVTELARRSRWKASRYVAFLLLPERGEKVEMIDLGESDIIDTLIAQFRMLVCRPAPERNGDLFECGSNLRRKLFDELIRVSGQRKRWFISPDGELNLLPMQVLPLSEREFLIDKYEFVYLSCGRDLLRNYEPSPPAGEPVVIADPAFNLSATDLHSADFTVAYSPEFRQSRDIDRGMRFQPLAGTRKEGDAVARHFGITPWMGKDAVKGRLRNLRGPKILHIATHGFFLPNQAKPSLWGSPPLHELEMNDALEAALLRSGLALSGANIHLSGGKVPPEAEDGLLTAQDVAELDLLGTELVVLSACDTGLGQVRTGEGVFGLRRAFVIAGAKRLVISMWKVPDSETQDLMLLFYADLATIGCASSSLRSAQLALRESCPDPYYWGAFICQGAPERLRLAYGAR